MKQVVLEKADAATHDSFIELGTKHLHDIVTEFRHIVLFDLYKAKETRISFVSLLNLDICVLFDLFLSR
jgi:hypothetical protein